MPPVVEFDLRNSHPHELISHLWRVTCVSQITERENSSRDFHFTAAIRTVGLPFAKWGF